MLRFFPLEFSMLKPDKRFRDNSRFFFAGMFCFFLVLCFNATVRFFETKHIILVEDSLFETVIKTAASSGSKNRRLVFKPLGSVTRPGFFFAGTSIPVAVMSTENNFRLDGTESQKKDEEKLSLRYVIGETVLIPSLPDDFQTAGNAISTLPPNFSVTVTKPEALPKNFRAVPANGLYAGEKDYPLTIQNTVRCTILEPQFKNAVAKLCSKIFTEVKQERKQTAFVASVGDLMLGRGVQDILMRDTSGLQKVFTETLPILQKNDITIGNLEGAVTEDERKIEKSYNFKFHKEVLPYLKAAGFNYLMVSNNHCYDYGETGFKDTLAALAEYDIPTSGAGATIDEAAQFYRTEKKGQKFSIISCGMYPVETSGFSGKQTAAATKTRAGILWASDELIASVAKEKAAGNFVIVNVHGGTEYHFTPSKQQRTFYEALCNAGADVVFGSHPHVLQPAERYKNSLIVYSLGNFIFNGMDSAFGATDTEIMRLGIYNGKILYSEKYPARIDGTRVLLRQ